MGTCPSDIDFLSVLDSCGSLDLRGDLVRTACGDTMRELQRVSCPLDGCRLSCPYLLRNPLFLIDQFLIFIPSSTEKCLVFNFSLLLNLLNHM